jgi:hypothetical protein
LQQFGVLMYVHQPGASEVHYQDTVPAAEELLSSMPKTDKEIRKEKRKKAREREEKYVLELYLRRGARCGSE